MGKVLTGNAIGFAELFEVLPCSQPFIKRKLLRNVADSGAGGGFGAAQICAGCANVAGGGRKQTAEHAEGRRFPGAVGTKEPKDFAAPHLKSAVGYGGEAAKAPRKANRLHRIFPGEKCCRGVEVFALGINRREILEL